MNDTTENEDDGIISRIDEILTQFLDLPHDVAQSKYPTAIVRTGSANPLPALHC